MISLSSLLQLYSIKYKIAPEVLESWEVPRHEFWQAWRAPLSSGQRVFGSLLQVTDDCTRCHFMAPSAMLKVEICERISREYISHQTWRSHPTCYEFYGGSDSNSLDISVCAHLCVTQRERKGEWERWNKSHNQLDKWYNILSGTCHSIRFMSLGPSSCSGLLTGFKAKLLLSMASDIFLWSADCFKDYRLHSIVPFASLI